MWKIVVGFVVFAGLALFLLMKKGGDIDMSGEKHGTETTHVPAVVTPAAPAAASAVSAAAKGASAP